MKVTVPWPTSPAVAASLSRGDTVFLRHIVHHNWIVEARVTHLTTPGRSVEVLPDEPITSPANWEIHA